MAIELAEAYVSLKMDVKALAKDMTSLKSNLDRYFNDIERRSKQAGMAAIAAFSGAIAAGAGLVTKSFIGAAASMEKMKLSLSAVTGSTQEANRQFRELIELAKMPGLGLPEIAKAVTSLQALDFEFSESKDIVREWGNELVKFGQGREALARIIVQMTQLAGKTSGWGQDLRQIAEAMPSLRKHMKTVFGTASSEEITKSGVTARQFIAGITEELRKQTRVVGGTQNAIDNFNDSLFQLKAALGEVLLPTFKEILDLLAKTVEWVNKLSDTQKKWIAWGTVATGAIAAIVAQLSLLALVIPKAISGIKLLAGFGTSITALPGILTAVIPLLGGIALGIADIAGAIKLYDNAVDSVKKKAKEWLKIEAKNYEGAQKAVAEHTDKIEKLKVELDKYTKMNIEAQRQGYSYQATLDAINARLESEQRLLVRAKQDLEKYATAYAMVTGKHTAEPSTTKILPPPINTEELAKIKKLYDEFIAELQQAKEAFDWSIAFKQTADGAKEAIPAVRKLSDALEELPPGPAAFMPPKTGLITPGKVNWEEITKPAAKAARTVSENFIAMINDLSVRDQVYFDERRDLYSQDIDAADEWFRFLENNINSVIDQQEKWRESYGELSDAEKDYWELSLGHTVDWSNMSIKEMERVKEEFTAASYDIKEGWKKAIAEMKNATIDWSELYIDIFSTMAENFASFFIASFEDTRNATKQLVEDMKTLITDMLKYIAKQLVMQGIATLLLNAAIPGAGIIPFAQGGIAKGGLSIPKLAGGGIYKQPTLAMIGEGQNDEAVIPLRGGKVPVELRGGGGMTIQTLNINLPYADLSRVGEKEVSQFVKSKLLPAINEAKAAGYVL